MSYGKFKSHPSPSSFPWVVEKNKNQMYPHTNHCEIVACRSLKARYVIILMLIFKITKIHAQTAMLALKKKRAHSLLKLPSGYEVYCMNADAKVGKGGG
jgi:hypothetical protein